MQRRKIVKYYRSKEWIALRKTAVGYDTRICWICGKTIPKHHALHIHHVFGIHNAKEPLVALCAGCHDLVTTLGSRNFLADAHKDADLITLARFIKGLPDARTIVIFEYSNGRTSSV